MFWKKEQEGEKKKNRYKETNSLLRLPFSDIFGRNNLKSHLFKTTIISIFIDT